MKSVELRSKRYEIPSAVSTALLVGLTSALFWLADDPQYAAYGAAGLAILTMAAKALDVNLNPVFSVAGKNENDVPDFPGGGFPTRAEIGAPAGQDDKPKTAPVSKLRVWLVG